MNSGKLLKFLILNFLVLIKVTVKNKSLPLCLASGAGTRMTTSALLLFYCNMCFITNMMVLMTTYTPSSLYNTFPLS